MGETAHINFIAAAYAAAVIILGTLALWVAFDFRALRRTLAELELQGLSRRSSASPAGHDSQRPKEPAKEKA